MDVPCADCLTGFANGSRCLRRTQTSAAEFFLTRGYGEGLLRESHYSQAVRVANRVETSGQGGWDDRGSFPENLADEIVQAFDNVELTLAEARASWRHVIQVNSYHVSASGGA